MSDDKIYKNKEFLYFWYVQKRATLVQIQKVLKEQHYIDVHSQTIYNYIKKYELDKLRGKGRRLNINKPKAIGMSPAQAKVWELRKRQRAILRSKKKS